MRKTGLESQNADSKINLSEYWRIAWRKKYLLLVPIFVPLIVSMIGVRFLVPVYQASSIIRMEDKNLLNREMARYVQLQDRRRMHDREAQDRIESELGTTEFIDQLIKRLGMDKMPDLVQWARSKHKKKYPDIPVTELINRRLRGRLLKATEVERVGPGMFQISFFDFDPEIAFVIANTITNLFIEMEQKKQIEGLQVASDFSDERLAIYKERFEKSEKELSDLKRKINRIKMKTNPVKESNLGYSETLLRQINIRVSDEENILTKIEGNLKALFGSVPQSDIISQDQELGKAVDGLKAKLEAQLLLQMSNRGESSSGTKRNAMDLEQAELTLQKNLSRIVRLVFTDIYSDYYPLIVEYYAQSYKLLCYRDQEKLLDTYVNSYKKKLELAPQWDRDLNKKEETVKLNKDLYNSFLKSKTTTQISEAAQNTNLGLSIEIVEQASKPMKPVRPNKPKIIVIALFFGMFLGVGGLILSEYSDTSFRSVEEIQEELEMKVLGTVPRFESQASWSRGIDKKKIAIWVLALLLVTVTSVWGFYYYGKSETENKLDIYSVTADR